MSEPREECYKCLNSSNCILIADYGSLYCVTHRKFNKTADEMFEKLGYTVQKNGNGKMIYYEYYDKKTEDIIQFWYDKTISKYNEDEADYITMQELAAINAKCQELGWIK